MHGAKILIIDDEKQIANALEAILEADIAMKLTVRSEHDGVAGLALAREWQPDLILLDLSLPGMHGYDILRAIHEEQPLCRVCIMTVSKNIEDRLAGFEYGTDDYVIKPFSSAEVLARVRALLRRDKIINETSITHPGISINVTNELVIREGKVVHLTGKEFALLSYLMARPGRVVNRDELLEHVWQGKDCYPNTVDAHVEGLRRKIDRPFSSALIKTAYRRGYYYELPLERVAA
jgi:DNA-binding response OmpR family regulator